MTFEENCCLAFDRVPTQLWPLFWQITYYDIQTKLRLYIGEKQLLVNQQFQVMSQVVSLAFGGGKAGGSDPVVQRDVPKTGAQALSMFAALKV